MGVKSLPMKGRGFVCQECGHRFPGWLGRCPSCGTWGSLVEEVGEEPRRRPPGTNSPPPVPLLEGADEGVSRLSTSMGEFDRPLGGGVVEGSVVLLGGAPGMGKSTLLLQVLGALSLQGVSVLYCSAEESLRQVRLRARRLGLRGPGPLTMATASLEELLREVDRVKPRVLAVDSLQALYTSELPSPAGSVAQVREVAARLTPLAKASGMALFLVGHITKEGVIAGPRLVEHLVDVVLYLEHRADSPYRVLRAVKNRFGSTNEIGVFEMTDRGLQEVKNPSEIFITERPEGSPGSVVMPTVEGTRPLLVEIQALVAPAPGGIPRRTAMGVDYNRLLLLVGILEKRVGIDLSHRDVFVNVAGGLRVSEPAVDLAAVAAILSSHLDRPSPPSTVVFGEVGLTGEVRGVSYGEERVAEAQRLGFTQCILPRSTARKVRVDGVRLLGVREVRELIPLLEGRR